MNVVLSELGQHEMARGHATSALRLIEEKGLEASDVMLWMDWPCIYQARPRPGRAAAPARAPTPARRAAAGRQGGEAQGRPVLD